MKVFFCFTILIVAVCAAPFEGGAGVGGGTSGSQSGVTAGGQTYQQVGGVGFFPHAGHIPFASGSQAGATAQTQTFHQGPGGFGGPTPYGFGSPAIFDGSAATAGASTQTFDVGGHGGGASGSQASATAQTQSLHG